MPVASRMTLEDAFSCVSLNATATRRSGKLRRQRLQRPAPDSNQSSHPSSSKVLVLEQVRAEGLSTTRYPPGPSQRRRSRRVVLPSRPSDPPRLGGSHRPQRPASARGCRKNPVLRSSPGLGAAGSRTGHARLSPARSPVGGKLRLPAAGLAAGNEKRRRRGAGGGGCYALGAAERTGWPWRAARGDHRSGAAVSGQCEHRAGEPRREDTVGGSSAPGLWSAAARAAELSAAWAG